MSEPFLDSEFQEYEEDRYRRLRIAADRLAKVLEYVIDVRMIRCLHTGEVDPICVACKSRATLAAYRASRGEKENDETQAKG